MRAGMNTEESHPRVSVIIACRNVGPYIDVALNSIRHQTLTDLEILLVDDRSTDDTRERALKHAAEDPRVIILDGTGNGPGAARNLAAASARGDWVAIVDGDDLIHPRRLETLAHAAEQSGADIIADNLIAFQDNPADGQPYFLLPMPDWETEREIDLAFFIRSNALFGRGAPLGYLKPLIRRDVLSRTGAAYDPTLRIGEDYDLVARLLALGARYRYFPAAFYFYRRHSASTSFRLTVPDVEAMIAAADAFAGNFQSISLVAQAASNFRRDSLVRALRFSQLLVDIKARRWAPTAWALIGDLNTLGMFAQAALSGIKRRLRQLSRGNKTVETARPRAVLLWQGAPSSAQALCADLAGRNYDVRFVRTERTGDQAAPFISAALALRLAGEAEAELLMCDADDLMPELSYALSPGASATYVRPPGGVPAIPLELEL
jgi:succinoglycan biosynthesis protein ExoO